MSELNTADPPLPGHSELTGRAALITGAASGIGRAAAERLSAAGMHVLAVDLQPDRDGPGVAHRADLTEPGTNEAAVQTALDQFGRLDVVVANAGVQCVTPIEQFPVEQWQRMIALMLTSPFLLARAAWPALRRSGTGRFIALSSVHGLVASPFKSAYVSAKHGLMGLVKTIALEGADDGISSVAICPGYVRTPLVERQVADQARHHGVAEEQVLDRVILAPQALKRLIEPGEIADMIELLAGPAGALFTGAPFVMDCGYTAH